MRIQCTVCKLPPDKQAEIDAALRRSDVSLQEIAGRTGVTKSALHRHRSKHIAPALVVIPAPAQSAVAAEVMAPAEVATVETFPVEVLGRETAEPPAIGQPASTPTKARFLERIEALWGESLDGLEAAKEPTLLSKPDGSTITIEGGDLRARAAFIREARGVLELQGEATGDLVKGQTPNLIGGVMIVCPSSMPSASEAPTVVIGVKQR